MLPTLLISTLALAACTPEKQREPIDGLGPVDSSSGTGTGPSDDFDPTEGTDAALAEFYSQEPAWEPCDASGMSFECTDITVPMDYDNPDGETITIAVQRYNANDDDGVRSLFLNPGGPGGSGTDMVEWAPYLVSPTVTDDFALVGFDPRGVETSSAVDCLSDADLDASLSEDIVLESDEDFAHLSELAAEEGQQCADATGPLLEFVDTQSTARDLDILRAVVARTPQLDYLGFSYGTFLGAEYAELFTDRVGAFVLDGAVDPSIGMREIALGQAEGFDRAIRSYMDNCVSATSCWHQGSADEGLEKIRQLFEVALATPLPTDDGDRVLTQSLALSGVITALYSNFTWPDLTSALDLAINENDGTGLLKLADTGNSRNPDGTFDGNGNEAFMAINCLDYPVEGTEADWRADGQEMKENFPIFGDAIAYGEFYCAQWPYQSERERLPIEAAGSAPILVIGTTRDPATPYEWSVSLAEQLENGHLLTHDGDGHTAYGTNACINKHVDEFLVSGTLPPDDTTC